MLTSRLDVYISRYGDFCAHDDNDDNDNDTTDYFTSCACARGNNLLDSHPHIEVGGGFLSFMRNSNKIHRGGL